MMPTRQRLHDIIVESINRMLGEVRYVDTTTDDKTNWYDVHQQEPIKNGDKIRVYHGCDLETAVKIAIQGTSGKVYHPRSYSYETGMNPLGIFVTTNFKTAKTFGSSNEGMCIIEFTADASDLEAPVWNGQDTFFGQGTNPQPFRNKEERNKQKQHYRQKALNTPDDYYYDNQFNKHNIDLSYIRNSTKPELAQSIFQNIEHQALFMGNLNPNQIKRVWVNLPTEKGYVDTTKPYQPLTRKQFIKQFANKQFQDGYDKNWQPKYKKIKRERLFLPNENVKDFNDLVDKIYQQDRKYYKSREEVEQNLKQAGLLQKTPTGLAQDYIKHHLWPKQIIQLYGKDYFQQHFDRLGQTS